MEEEEGLKTRSFRHEDYNTRRAFLRSYPLQWDDETGEEVQTDHARESTAMMSIKRGKAAASVKKKLIMVFHWGEGKCLILRRIKDRKSVV